jgi:membrane-associated phospholipid phosphatase
VPVKREADRVEYLARVVRRVCRARSLCRDDAVRHTGLLVGNTFDSAETDWHRLFRICGYAPTWLAIGAAMMLIDYPRVKQVGWKLASSRPGLLLTSIILGALTTEGMKVLVRRGRPNQHGGNYEFRDWSDGPLDATGLGMPSSHTGVAFAAMGMLCYLYPRAWPIWITLAIGCGFTRFMNISHFVTDVAVAAVLGLLIARAVWYMHIHSHGLDARNLKDRPFG